MDSTLTLSVSMGLPEGWSYRLLDGSSEIYIDPEESAW